MSSEQIINRLERELGANWWDSTDINERVQWVFYENKNE